MKKAKIMNAFNSLIEQFKAQIVTSFDEDEVQQAEVQAEVTTYALKDDPNVTVAVDAEGNVTFSDGREIVDGEYALDADLVLVIENGKGEVKQVEVKEDEKPAEAPLDASAQEQPQENFDAQKQEFESQIAELGKANEELTAKVVAFENEVANFATVKADFEAQIAELQKENEALKSQIPSKVGEFNVNDKPQEQEVKVDLWQQAYGSK